MEEKYEAFQNYNWTRDQEWQTYLNNLFPTPPMKILQKRKRKWYKEYIDKDFDINYEPGSQPNT